MTENNDPEGSYQKKVERNAEKLKNNPSLLLFSGSVLSDSL